MRGRFLLVLFLGLWAGAASSALADAGDRPSRIVSLNLCADELVLRLADREDVASVTWLARDPDISNVARRAAHVGVNHGLAEEILPLEPDLVLAGVHTTRTTVAFLKSVGIPVVELGVPQSLDAVYAQIRKVAAAVGQPERGARMIAEIRRGLARASAESGQQGIGAFVLRPNGYTVSDGSLVDTLLERAGLVNLAARRGLDTYGQIPLETVLLSDAELLIIDAEVQGYPSMTSQLLRHPALVKSDHTLDIVRLPSRLWNCAGPRLVDAVERLARAASRIEERESRP